MSENIFRPLDQYKFAIALIPVINYFIYITYSIIKYIPTGVLDLMYSYIGIPLTFLLSLIIYIITLFMGKDSELSVLILIIYAILSVIVLIYKIVNYKKIQHMDISIQKLS